MTYIHYGTDHFNPALFASVRNGGLEYGFRPKPADGTGLWASREGDPNGWEAWCRGARFHLDALSQSFRFTMPGAKILLLDDPEQLIALPIPVRNGGLRQKELCAKNDRRNRFGFRLPPFSYSDLMGKLP